MYILIFICLFHKKKVHVHGTASTVYFCNKVILLWVFYFHSVTFNFKNSKNPYLILYKTVTLVYGLSRMTKMLMHPRLKLSVITLATLPHSEWGCVSYTPPCNNFFIKMEKKLSQAKQMDQQQGCYKKQQQLQQL